MLNRWSTLPPSGQKIHFCRFKVLAAKYSKLKAHLLAFSRVPVLKYILYMHYIWCQRGLTEINLNLYHYVTFLKTIKSPACMLLMALITFMCLYIFHASQNYFQSQCYNDTLHILLLLLYYISGLSDCRLVNYSLASIHNEITFTMDGYRRD